MGAVAGAAVADAVALIAVYVATRGDDDEGNFRD
jgi:hypothetical protein